MTTGKIHDVLVVGGGPVACRVASELAHAGYDVAVLEQKPSLDAPVCCTGLVSAECLSRFDIDPKLITNMFYGASVYAPNGNEIKVHRAEAQAHLLGRPGLDRALCDAALTSGAAYLFGHRVTSLHTTDNGASVEATAGSGVRQLQARAIVIATGFGSRLLDGTGIRRGPDWAVGAQARVGAGDATGVEVFLGRSRAPGFFAWLVPDGRGQALVGLIAKRGARRYFEDFMGYLKNSGRVANTAPPLLRGITLSPPSRTYAERCLVVGDAAGQVKPLTGGGLYFGLLCADMAARHLSSALKQNDLSAVALSAYEREWRAALGRELRLGRAARRAFGLLGDGQIGFLFALAKRYHLAERLAERGEIGFDWHGAALSRAWRLINPLGLKE